MTIAQSATELTVAYRIDTAGREAVDTFTYKLDGSETDNRMGGAEYRSNAKWDGARLVVSSAVSQEGNSLGVTTDVLRIEHGELVIESNLKNSRGTFSTKRAYRKD